MSLSGDVLVRRVAPVALVLVLLGALIGICASRSTQDAAPAGRHEANVAPEQISAAKRLGVVVAFDEPKTGLRFVLVPGTVEVPAFYLSTTEVSNSQYGRFDPTHHSTFLQADQPVDMVSCADAAAFCEWLSAGKHRGGYRLPREAEWEHACRAGTTTAFAFGEVLVGAQANFNDSLGSFLGRTTPVGSYRANRWGLFDMHGNLWELCATIRGKAVLRGGSWRHGAERARSDSREETWLSHEDPDTGFRIARNALGS